jgi:hypothetical protein
MSPLSGIFSACGTIKDKAAVTFRRKASGEVTGEIVDEKGKIARASA